MKDFILFLLGDGHGGVGGVGEGSGDVVLGVVVGVQSRVAPAVVGIGVSAIAVGVGSIVVDGIAVESGGSHGSVLDGLEGTGGGGDASLAGIEVLHEVSLGSSDSSIVSEVLALALNAAVKNHLLGVSSHLGLLERIVEHRLGLLDVGSVLDGGHGGQEAGKDEELHSGVIRVWSVLSELESPC